jgi:hypothetical protein
LGRCILYIECQAKKSCPFLHFFTCGVSRLDTQPSLPTFYLTYPCLRLANSDIKKKRWDGELRASAMDALKVGRAPTQELATIHDNRINYGSAQTAGLPHDCAV